MVLYLKCFAWGPLVVIVRNSRVSVICVSKNRNNLLPGCAFWKQVDLCMRLHLFGLMRNGLVKRLVRCFSRDSLCRAEVRLPSVAIRPLLHSIPVRDCLSARFSEIC